ncbi:hypothetical protein GCM10007094_31600 [Pseudovibrio japonicus]|uniref:STAS/SEC14 domain-containing protein n=1 Tax=Pseudovibrio japonicus TaxID=366534 RepID=A0ABQ3EHU4_9HYPH|nr:STAS/SEC14 domain-containing protein [Pseudovibrio japonicus]GHB40001.1 hypothetical protein GCM10007094_31600 [Pseudovibrio japonicus]
MFKHTSAAEHVLDVRFSDKISAGDVKEFEGILAKKLEKNPHLHLLLDFNEVTDISKDAMVEGLGVDLEFFRHIKQFSRCAVISDKEWPQAVAGFFNKVFPVIDRRVFSSSQVESAREWVAEKPATTGQQTPGFRRLNTTNDKLFAFEINGMISAEEMPAVLEDLKTFLDGHDKIFLLNRIKHFGGIDPAIFMQSGLLSARLATMQKAERYAIVGPPEWVEKVLHTLPKDFLDIEIKSFKAEDEDKAWDWLDAKPKEN